MKLKPHKGVYKIPIHRHTPVRRRPSKFIIGEGYNYDKNLVTDLTSVALPPHLTFDFRDWYAMGIKPVQVLTEIHRFIWENGYEKDITGLIVSDRIPQKNIETDFGELVIKHPFWQRIKRKVKR